MADSVQLPPLPRVYAQAHLGLFAQERGQYQRANMHMDRYAQGLDSGSPGGGLLPRLRMVEHGVVFGDDPARLLRIADDVVASAAWRDTPPLAQADPLAGLRHQLGQDR